MASQRQMARPERSHLEAHYADLSGKGFFAGLIDYMVSESRQSWLGGEPPQQTTPRRMIAQLCHT